MNNYAPSGSYTVKMDNCQVTGSTNTIWNDAEFTVRIGACKLDGGAVAVNGGTVSCIGAYDENYTSPGYTNERTHQFFAELESAPAAQSPDPDENLEVVHMEQDEIAGMVARGEMADAKTVLLWLACRNAGLI